MSSTESHPKIDMVSVPRELVERIADHCKFWVNHPYLEAIADVEGNLRALLAQPAEQHQGEPVALPARRQCDGWLDLTSQDRGWNACLDEIAKLGPLYTHPVPAVEQGYSHEVVQALQTKADTLRAQLAKRDALLREADGLMRGGNMAARDERTRSRVYELSGKIDAALSASAEPSADHSVEAGKMVERDPIDMISPEELAAFEAWRKEQMALERKP